MDVGPAIRPAPPFCTKSARFCRANVVEKPQKTRKRHARRQGKPGGSAARRASRQQSQPAASQSAPAASQSQPAASRAASRQQSRSRQRRRVQRLPFRQKRTATRGKGGDATCHADAAKTRFYYMRAPQGTVKQQNSHFDVLTFVAHAQKSNEIVSAFDVGQTPKKVVS